MVVPLFTLDKMHEMNLLWHGSQHRNGAGTAGLFHPSANAKTLSTLLVDTVQVVFAAREG